MKAKFKMAVVRPMTTVYSCNNVVITTTRGQHVNMNEFVPQKIKSLTWRTRLFGQGVSAALQ